MNRALGVLLICQPGFVLGYLLITITCNCLQFPILSLRECFLQLLAAQEGWRSVSLLVLLANYPLCYCH